MTASSTLRSCATTAALALLLVGPTSAQVPAAIYTDPPADSLHPARSEVLHIPTGGVEINGLAYIAEGAGTHPVMVLLHGLPGNEKNLDLAQAVRRAGWTVVTFNYRGSWGSPGSYRFGQNLEDADAVLAFLHDTSNVRRLGIDPSRIVMAGHSMGGWVTALTAARHPELLGAVLISAADMGAAGGMLRDRLVSVMADNMEALAGVTAESMADDLIAGAPNWGFGKAAAGLGRMPLLVLTANDGLAQAVAPLVEQLRAGGNRHVTTVHQPTDHSWSDKRIALAAAVITWLERLPAAR
ncbi:MAG TPA: alpha/beta fold hydrolase [Gemmatimonadales bacterium]|nr:alpha/beta fold hydrolase [Gemmatimonadales bacterium]